MRIPDDLERSAAPFLGQVQARSQHAKAPTVALLIEKWQTFVESVEVGYQLTVYDYTNDLDTRQILHDLQASLPALPAGQLHWLLSPIDRRFLDATRPIGALDPADDQWWSCRVPRKLVGELENDVLEGNFP